MVHLNKIVLVLLLAGVCPVLSNAAESTNQELPKLQDPAKLIPSIQVGDKLTLRLWGFSQAQMTFTEATPTTEEEESWQWTNLRLLGNLDGKRLGLGFVFNFSDLQERDGNWLRELYGQVKLTDSLKLRAGRLLLSTGNGNALPGPFKWETVAYPKSLRFGQYGTGIQTLWNQENWSAIMDVTGDSSLPFDDPGSLQDLECSARLKRTFRDQERELGWLAGSVQLTNNVYRFGLDSQWQPVKTLTLRGGAVYSDYEDKKTSNQLGGFALVAYRPISLLEIHTMLDQESNLSKEYQELQKQKDEQGNVTYQKVTMRTSDATVITWTNGLRLIGKADHWAVTLDYEAVLEGQRPDRILARAQIRF